jgi:hypothetical protein
VICAEKEKKSNLHIWVCSLELGFVGDLIASSSIGLIVIVGRSHYLEDWVYIFAVGRTLYFFGQK